MEAIERLAEQFLAGVPSYVWDGETLPIPIDEIADSHVGLLVREVQDMASAPGAPPLDDGQSLAGLLLPAQGEIWVNATEAREWPTRRRFTIAHELGHWRLHREAEKPVFCRATSLEVASQERSPLPQPEEQANAFAAAVLMPERLIQEQYVRCKRDFDLLCETFGASGAAMGRRLHTVIKPGGTQRDR